MEQESLDKLSDNISVLMLSKLIADIKTKKQVIKLD